MGGLRRFTKMFEAGSTNKVTQAGDHLDHIGVMLRDIGKKLDLLYDEETKHNISLEALANDMSVSTPKSIRSDTEGIYAEYILHLYTHQCLKRNKHATKAQKIKLLTQVMLLEQECKELEFQATQTTASIYKRPGAPVLSERVREVESLHLLQRASKHTHPNNVMSEICGLR